MNVIEEIKKARIDFVPQEYKSQVLQNTKEQLVNSNFALIEGAQHFQNQEWSFRGTRCRAPFKYHAAMATWLESVGFHTSRYYNKGGIDNGLQVWI